MKTLKLESIGRGPFRVGTWALGVIAVWLLASPSFAWDNGNGHRLPILPSPLCDSLQVPAGNELAFHVYALGYQIYRWDGTRWVFVAPDATLFADPGYHGVVGKHFAGPTWRSNSGSEVVGTRFSGCTPDPQSIPWLLLVAVSSHGPGIFDGITMIQRLNTVGGTAPSTPGSAVGEMAAVPYSAEYFFYRGDNEAGADPGA